MTTPIPHAAAAILAEALLSPFTTRADLVRLAEQMEATAKVWGEPGYAGGWLSAGARLRLIAEAFPAAPAESSVNPSAGPLLVRFLPESLPPAPAFVFGIYRDIAPPLARADTLEIAESLASDAAADRPGAIVTVVQAMQTVRRPLDFHRKGYPR